MKQSQPPSLIIWAPPASPLVTSSKHIATVSPDTEEYTAGKNFAVEPLSALGRASRPMDVSGTLPEYLTRRVQTLARIDMG